MSEQSGRDAGGHAGDGADVPPGRPGQPPGASKLPPGDAEAWHHALISLYYYGRQNQGTLGRNPPPLGVRSLEHAVSVLAGAAVGPVRLALADLCRTRAARPTSRTLQLAMRRLAISYQRHLRRLLPELRDARLDLPGAFDDLFRTHGRLDPEAAYAGAIGIMLQHERSRLPDNQRPVLDTYSVSSS